MKCHVLDISLFIIARFLRVGDLSQNVFAQENKKTLTGVEKLIAEALSGAATRSVLLKQK